MKTLHQGLLTTTLAAAAVTGARAATFGEDVAFLKQHTPILVLSDAAGQAKVAVAPAWQGRVMTSTTGGDAGPSYGWINRELIASGKLQPHINVFGGEDRFWLGPEGGQFSIFFAKGAKFELADWQTPPPLDTMAYPVKKHSATEATFEASFALTNYSGTRFQVKASRKVQLLPPAVVARALHFEPDKEVQLVGFESVNKITNAGKEPWTQSGGLLSIWILGMFNPSPTATVVVPIKPGPESELGPKVTSDYFGAIPPERLAVQDMAIFLSADGQFRSKIGVSPKRSKALLGSYDAANRVLTIVQFTQPEGAVDYVNSLWKIQSNPYGGDAANSYNDGPPAPGAKPLGPFYELESSSPAAALKPGKTLSHTHRTIHLTGPEISLDKVARAVLGVSLSDFQTALRK